MKKHIPLLANLVSQTFLGFSYLFIRIGMAVIDQDTLKFLSFRFSLAVCFIAMLMLLPNGPRLRRPGKGFALLMACSLLNPLVSQFAKTASTTYVATSLISLFNSMLPVVMIGFSALLNHEYPTRRQVCFILVTVAGMLMASLAQWTGAALTPLGLFLIVLYIVMISLSRVLVRRASGSFTAYEITFFQTLFGAVGFSSLLLVRETHAGHSIPSIFAGLARPDFAIALLFTSLGTCVIAFLLMNYAASQLPFAVYSASCTWSTVVGILSGVFILHEPFTALQVAGTIVILSGILGISFSYPDGDHRFQKK